MSIGIGATLRDAREAQGRSTEDVAARLRARTSQLEALEEERFDEFGGEVYAKGFLRNYAAELGLDPQPLLELYRTEVSQIDEPLTPLTVKMGTPRAGRAAPPAWMAWVLAAVVVVAGISIIGGLFDGGPTPDQASPSDLDGPPPAPAPETPEDDEIEPGLDPQEPEEPVEAEPEPEPEPEEEFDGVDLLLALEADSWMRVIVDGSVVLEQTVPAGETLPFEAEQEIEVRFGNAGGVRANLNGEDLGAQGSSGEAITLRYTPDGTEEV